MQNSYKNKQGGLIKMIIIIIIAILILSWFGVDIKKFFESEQVKNNLGYVWNYVSGIWHDYLAAPAQKVWDVWIQYIWDPLILMLKLK
jgi:amino acid transporter